MSLLRRRFGSVPAVALAMGVYACGESIVLPDEGEPARITVVSGDEQSGPAGATLGQQLVVKVSDTRGSPVVNQGVEFTVEAGNGEIAPATATTNSEGHAAATWKLGPGVGEQRVQVRASGGAAPATLVVGFTATAISGSAGLLELVSGDGQVGGVSSALAESLVVRVTDGLGNGVAGVTVTWSVSGGGSIDPTSGVSGDDGTVSAQRTLGPTAGLQTAQAAVELLGNSPVTFTHTADASNPTSLVLVSGDGQSAPAGFQLPDSLVVRLLDDNGNGIGGRSVTWVVAASAGAVNPVNSTTTPDGYAVTRWTLGSAAGSHSIDAVFSGLETVPFTATATSDVPTAIALVSGSGQTAPVGTTLPSPLRVRVTDANGNPVENVSVTWGVSGDGSVSSTTTGTDAQGVAQVTMTLGGIPGTYTTTATVAGLSGSPITFTAFAEVGRATRVVFLSQPPSALVVGQTLPDILVEIQDAQGNRVSDAINRVRISSSVAGTLTGANQQDAVGGVATFSGLAINRTGSAYRLIASSSGLTEATSDAFDVGRGATGIVIASRSPSGSTVTGRTVTINYDINVAPPAAGSLTGSVQVSDGVQTCTGGINAGTGVGSCSIDFQTAGTHNLTATYSGDVNFTGSVSAAVAHTVSPANTTVNIGSLPASTVGQPLTVPFSVTVNSPGSGTPTGTVTITVGGGSETCSAAVAVGSCQLTPLSGGNRTFTATYPGDPNYNGDTDSESHPIRTETSTAVATSNGATVFGQSVTFTATVSAVGGSGTPTGSVQFKADGVDIGGPASLSGGVANRATSSLSAGSHTITAEYIPTGLFAASSGTLAPNQQVSPATTTTTITGINPEPSNPGQAYTVSVVVQAVSPGGGTPGGSVAVTDGEGGVCSAPLSNGSGSCALSTATPGGKTVTATFGNGDPNYVPGSTGSAAHQVNNPPSAAADSYAVPANFFIAPTAAEGVLVNDSDPDGHALTAVLDLDVSNGALLLNGNGGFLYTPNPGFVGTDSFTYHATDGFANSGIVTVTLQVGP